MSVDKFTNPELVTIAVSRLGGDSEYIDREDIALQVNEMAPGRFNWRKYPENIDLDIVGVALRDAKKPKNGGFLIGDNSRGWMLSPNGINWMKSLDAVINNFENDAPISPRKHSLHSNLEAERVRLRNTTAFQLYSNNDQGGITLQHFYQFARVNEYFKSKTRERRYSIVDNAVVGDENLSEVWGYLKNKFSQEMY